MDWLTDISLIWLEWQVRAMLFAIIVIWAALGTGLRSPVWRCAVLVIGCWILVLFPVLLIVFPKLEIEVLVPSGKGLSAFDSYFVTTLFALAVVATSLLVIRVLGSLKRLIRLHSSLRETEEIQVLFDECKTEVGLGDSGRFISHTKCYISELADQPLTYGVWKNYVVLPEDALEWPREELRVCLIHELWHVKRGDWLSQQVASLVSLFNVLNPFVWAIRRELDKKIESSVDKLCIQGGIDSHHYADVLLRQTRSRQFLPGFGTPIYFGAHRYGRADIQQRIGALVDEPFGWASVSIWKLLPLATVLFAVAVFLSTIQPIEHSYEPPDYYELLSLTEVVIEVPQDYLLPEFSDEPGFPIHSTLLSSVAESGYSALSGAVNPQPARVAVAETYSAFKTPELLVRVKPGYPSFAKENGIEGYVDVEFDITLDGATQNLKVLVSEPSDIFDQEALRAVAKWRYRPEIVNGQPVAVSGHRDRVLFEIDKTSR